jgi:hypothetical protein
MEHDPTHDPMHDPRHESISAFYQDAASPPAFIDVIAQLPASFDDAALAEAVRRDAAACGTLFELVPTIGRYAHEVHPAVTPRAANEVAHQVLNAARSDAHAAVEFLVRKYPAWREPLLSAAFALDLIGAGVPASNESRGKEAVLAGLRMIAAEVQAILDASRAGVGPTLADGAPRFLLGEVRSRGSFGVVIDATDRALDGVGKQGSVVVKFLFRQASGPRIQHRRDESNT